MLLIPPCLSTLNIVMDLIIKHESMVPTFTATDCVEHTTTKYLEDNER